VLPAQLTRLAARLALLQYPDDLFFVKSAVLHSRSFPQLSLLRKTQFRVAQFRRARSAGARFQMMATNPADHRVLIIVDGTILTPY
jgi:hypothetical protein